MVLNFKRISSVMYDMECASSSSSDEEFVEQCAVASFILNNKRRKCWVHEINRNRQKHGAFHTLIRELELDQSRYHMYFRMNKEQFEYLHNLVKEKIKKRNTRFRSCIGTRERLAVCLRYLATGNSFRSIAFTFRIGFNTVRNIVKSVCKAIWEILSPIVMPEPTEQLWKEVAQRYKYMWNFPNCIGAIDGKHINLRCPIRGGSAYYNYKGTHSIVLLALVDANYKFIAIDVGSYGRNSDGSIFSKSTLGEHLESGLLNVPADAPLVENGMPLPHVIVGDEAFPLKSYLLRPYSRNTLNGDEAKKVFNYRLSRARRISENCFGILAARWRVFTRYFEVQPVMVDIIVMACCCLHNMLCTENPEFEADTSSFNGCNSAFVNIEPIRRNIPQRALYIREQFKEYFNSPQGSVPWQLELVRRGGHSQGNNDLDL